MTTHKFTRGETIAIGLENLDGAEVSSITAALKAKGPGGAPTGPRLATFEIEARDEITEGHGPGWVLSLAPEVSLGLQPGSYLCDARMVIGGGVTITEMLNLYIAAGVTETAS